MTNFGIDVLLESPEIASNWGKVGLLANQASRTKEFTSSTEAIHNLFGKSLTCLFGPQHGYVATVQDNMIETPHMKHELLQLPIYSLYSETREPTAEMFENLDTLIFDLQISGCRIYTFKATLFLALQACKKFGKKMVVLDRPNPLGGENIEGPVLADDAKSFVGPFPLPMRHGMSVGECARLFNSEVGAEVEIVEMQGWDPTSHYGATGRPWILTSPNLPTLSSVLVYPGTVLFEGTNISEGRGTCLPFQLLGAPYLSSSEAFLQKIMSFKPNLNGMKLIPTQFQPTSQKWADQNCHGIQIVVNSSEAVIPNSFGLGLAIMRAAYELGGEKFQWKKDPYEYDFRTLPIKLIFGKKDFDDKLLSESLDLRDPYYTAGIEDYIQVVKEHLIYPRHMSAADLSE